MFNLFGNKNAQYGGVHDPDTIKGKFVYQCLVTCPKDNKTHIAIATTHDENEVVQFKCPCGYKMDLPTAPVMTTWKFGEIEHTSRKGASSIKISNGHSIKIGDTLEYVVNT